jgi:hypothetical protein
MNKKTLEKKKNLLNKRRRNQSLSFIQAQKCLEELFNRDNNLKNRPPSKEGNNEGK